jgi:hypothetical protein
MNIVDCSSLNLTSIIAKDDDLVAMESATDYRLTANRISIIKARAFFGFSQLKYLYMQGNIISDIESNAFINIKSTVRLINLGYNKLETVRNDQFAGLTELKLLIFSGNPIKFVSELSSIHSDRMLPQLRLLFLIDTLIEDRDIERLKREQIITDLKDNDDQLTIVVEEDLEPVILSTKSIETTTSPFNTEKHKNQTEFVPKEDEVS